MTAPTTRPRRRKGEGSTRQLANGKWEARFYNDRRERRSRVFDSEAQAVAFLAQTNVARTSGDVVVGSTMTLETYLCGPDGWLATYGPRMGDTTRTRYADNVRLHIVPLLGRVRLGELRERHIVQMQNALRDAGKAPATIRNVHATLGVALTRAVRDRLIGRNVANMVDRPTTPKRTVRGKKIVPPTLADLGAVIDALAGAPAQLPFRVTAATGLRIGELQGLRWGDLRPMPDGGWLLVVDGKWNTQKRRYDDFTKSASGARVVRVARALADDLTASRPADADDAAYMFPGRQRRTARQPIGGDALRDQLAQAQAAAGVAPFRWHDVRHAYPTVLRARGDDWLAISRSMGHSRVAVTTDLYGHLDLTTVAPLDDPRDARRG